MNAIDMRQVIPSPLAADDEEVRWALSTASALWASGEHDDAVRWLRRAAETANDREEDERALELFKAAATIRGSMPPVSAPSAAAPDTSRAPAPVPEPPPVSVARPPVLPRARSSAPPSRSTARLATPPPAKPRALPRVAPPPLRRPSQVVTELKVDDADAETRVHSREALHSSAPPSPAPATLQAVQVAVVRGEGGEPRIVPLARGVKVPRGAFTALLVPTSESDAEAILAILSG